MPDHVGKKNDIVIETDRRDSANVSQGRSVAFRDDGSQHVTDWVQDHQTGYAGRASYDKDADGNISNVHTNSQRKHPR